jgi:hypothetical protein
MAYLNNFPRLAGLGTVLRIERRLTYSLLQKIEVPEAPRKLLSIVSDHGASQGPDNSCFFANWVVLAAIG